jgi:hypothetical protein
MTDRFVTHAFTAGELSTQFYGRTDLDKYDLGVSQAENFYVDYRGGLKTRPGTAFHEYEKGGIVRYFPFFLGEAESDILLIVGEGYIRFAQNGSFLLDPPRPAASANTDGLITMTTTGLATGDWAYVSGTGFPADLYELTVISGNQLTIARADGRPLGPLGAAETPTLSRVLQRTTPYTATDLPQLKISQQRFTAIFTSVNHRPQLLELTEAGWNFRPVPIDATIRPPDDLVLTPSSGGAARIVFTVTSVDENGVESSAFPFRLATGSVNYAVTAGSMTASWQPRAGAVSYRVYRSIISENPNTTIAQELGFIGETVGTSFIDNNIIPDFLRKPPRGFNPFAPGAIIEIEVTAGGSGYGFSPLIQVAGGSGFRGAGIVQDGAIVGIIILRAGRDFTTDSVVTISGAGTGATARVKEVSPTTGNFPRVSTMFQQRRVYAGTTNLPMTLFGSKPGSPYNFDFSTPPAEDDSYTFTIDAGDVVPIKHLVPIRDGLLVLHRKGVDRIVAESGRAVTPLNRYVENQAAVGVGDADPILINNDLVYATARGTGLQALTYTFYTNSYTPQDLTVLSSHIFKNERSPVRLAWQEEPDKLLWVALADGRLACLTYLREQEIFGWSQHWTRGRVLDLVTIREKNRDVVYLLIERLIQGRRVLFRESFQPRNFAVLEDVWAVDAGLRYEGARPEATLSGEENEEYATLTTTSAVFTASEPGHVVRAWGGVYEIDEVVSAQEVTARIIRRAWACRPGCRRLDPRPPGAWTLSVPITTISGLDHLEGETVSILADGDVKPAQVVTAGQVTIDRPASQITVGLSFTATVKTLPLSSLELRSDGRKKRVVGTAIRLNETRGLEYGTKKLYEMKDKGWEDWGAETPLRSDNSVVMVSARWEQDATLTFVQRQPLPASILGLVTEVEQGD